MWKNPSVLRICSHLLKNIFNGDLHFLCSAISTKITTVATIRTSNNKKTTVELLHQKNEWLKTSELNIYRCISCGNKFKTPEYKLRYPVPRGRTEQGEELNGFFKICVANLVIFSYLLSHLKCKYEVYAKNVKKFSWAQNLGHHFSLMQKLLWQKMPQSQ